METKHNREKSIKTKHNMLVQSTLMTLGQETRHLKFEYLIQLYQVIPRSFADLLAHSSYTASITLVGSFPSYQSLPSHHYWIDEKDIYIQYIRGDNLLGPADTLEHKDVCVDVLHLQPAGNTERRISPHPVHQGSQLQQERHR